MGKIEIVKDMERHIKRLYKINSALWILSISNFVLSVGILILIKI